MTNSFKEKLGQGGFGGVLKGKLLDGRLVAVKVMRNSKVDGEDIMNESTSLQALAKLHISLEKFIYKDKPLEKSSSLPWKKLYEIVIGVSRGLERLHRGCNTRIVHFDIKPQHPVKQKLLPKDIRLWVSNVGCKRVMYQCWMQEGLLGTLRQKCFSLTLK
ncbi:hypothetical protein GIB67_001965 [Kingdonia uniflora]|uniref:Protein kinase domain-containing protein n=1 Tax=Kingdonia uniflora TaxID=39325 RepID=A0A7J7MA24_9MAGN|nr:hypothetical protein GIB67_001965 [Kingdonia uniflora]